MSVKVDFQQRPPHGSDHTACDTPNPPWWCDDVPQTPIDDGLWILIIIALLIGVVYLITKYKEVESFKD